MGYYVRKMNKYTDLWSFQSVFVNKLQFIHIFIDKNIDKLKKR